MISSNTFWIAIAAVALAVSVWLLLLWRFGRIEEKEEPEKLDEILRRLNENKDDPK